MILFLSFIPISCIVVFNRELANILFPFDISILFTLTNHNNTNIDIKINTLRDQLNIPTTNNSRESLVLSNVLSVPYVERMQALNNSLIQCHDLKILELVNKKNLVLELIQENLIENSIQDCLPYILNTNGLCSTTLAYSK